MRGQVVYDLSMISQLRIQGHTPNVESKNKAASIAHPVVVEPAATLPVFAAPSTLPGTGRRGNFRKCCIPTESLSAAAGNTISSMLPHVASKKWRLPWLLCRQFLVYVSTIDRRYHLTL